jgi:hypothetical protein
MVIWLARQVSQSPHQTCPTCWKKKNLRKLGVVVPFCQKKTEMKLLGDEINQDAGLAFN